MKLNQEESHIDAQKKVNGVNPAMVLSSTVFTREMERHLILKKWCLRTIDIGSTTTEVTTNVTTEQWVEIQIEAIINNASVMMSNLSTSKRLKLMRDTIDSKKRSEETKEDLECWPSREEEDCNKRKKEEKD